MTNNNIQKTILRQLCLKCGACYAACPVNAVSIDTLEDGYPKIDHKLCNNCGLCLKVCPGMFPEYNSVARCDKLGMVLNTYSGCACRPDIRNRSSSGGIATALSLYLLKTKKVSGIIMARSCASNPLRNEAIIAKNEADILSCMGSRYSPTFTCKILKEIDYKKHYAFIGKPCDIQALYKLIGLDKKLEEIIVYKIGLFCHHVPDYICTDRLVKHVILGTDKVGRIQYRGDGWPGFFKIYDKKDKLLFQEEYHKIWSGYLSAMNKRCEICSDCTAEYADISLGDPWLKEFKGEIRGANIIVTRNKKGEELIREAANNGDIIIEPLERRKVEEGQRELLKKKNRAAFMALKNIFLCKPIPNLKINPITLYKAFAYIISRSSRKCR